MAALTAGTGLAAFSGLYGALTSAAIGIGITTGVGVLAFSVAAVSAGLFALQALSRVLAPKPAALGAAPQTFRQVIANSQIIYGKCRVGGLLNFYHATKVDKYDYRYFVVTLAGHAINGITKYWLGDEEVTVDGTGLVTSGKYASNCWIWPELGSASAVANATFVSECGGQWTTDHRGRGVAKLYVKFKLTDEVIAEGFPNITVEVEGKNDIYDPRTETTGYTDNAILCIYDWLLMARADGGFGVDEDEVDWDFVSSQANICDEDVPLKAGGSEPRYTCNGFITTGAEPDGIRDALLTSCAGEFTYSGGLYKVYGGAFRAVSTILEEGDLAGNIGVSPLASGDSIANEVRGTFNDPSQKYQPQELPALALSTTDDLKTLDPDLPFTKSNTMGQRICKIMLLRAASERTVTWPVNLKGLAVEALDTVQLYTSRYGLSNYVWKVQGWGLNEDFSVTLQLREEDPEIYDWTAAADEQDALAAAAAIVNPPAIEVGGGAAPTFGTLTADSTTQITVPFTMPDTASVVGWDMYRGTTSTFSAATLTHSGVAYPSQTVSQAVTGLTTATTYYFWIRARLGTGAYSPTAGPVSKTTL